MRIIIIFSRRQVQQYLSDTLVFIQNSAKYEYEIKVIEINWNGFWSSLQKSLFLSKQNILNLKIEEALNCLYSQ